MDFPRLIVVSNREPYEHRWVKDQLVCERTDGGLTSALDPVLQRLGGTWVAWGSGKADRDAVGMDMGVRVPPASPAYWLRRVWLEPDEVKGGYLGYANQVLWPLCHITLDRVAYLKAFWPAYRSMNARFADTVLDELRKEPGLVWVHDFHLALLPPLIKKAAPVTTVSFFWHIAWPGPEVFRILPERRAVLEGLLAADSLVFQTPSYAHAFAECARELLGAEVNESRDLVQYTGHSTNLTARPISVDFQTFSDRAKWTHVEWATTLARRRLGVRPDIRLGLGVDRLDYTKGLLKRLWALDTFFTRFPQYRGAFTFVQVAVPTRSEVEAYRRYREVIRETVAEINHRHAVALTHGATAAKGWRPIELHEGRVGFDTLLAYYRMAELALVSSVYDGMNLVAKEYVAAQIDETGVLLVSQMAGAAEELTEAIVINPYDTEGLAEAIKEALEMPAEERRRRMRQMRAYLAAHDIHAWVEGCLRDAVVASNAGPGAG
ncbi:MAG: trehalose-6-phosphate synthase [Nitrospirae bacterium]|nr:trehalose-6-phosphate synthase [Nitrospirota bacterium]